MIRYFFLTAFFGLSSLGTVTAKDSDRPNILWLVIDDMGADFSCYGEKVVETPNIDRLAREGTRFTNAFLTAPVCSTARSSMITGMYQTTIGAHNHLSGRGKHRIALPGKVVPVPVLFGKAGYVCTNENYPTQGGKPGKADYNFDWDKAMYDGPGFPKSREEKPFFAQLQLHGGKYRGGFLKSKWQSEVAPKALGTLTDPEKVVLPPYYPRDPVILQDWANYLDTVRYTDREVGEIIATLEKEGILDETIIILFGDNGISHARGKQFVYDEGIYTPLIIRGPGVAAGKVRDDLVEHIDLAATSLALAGAVVPEWMQGDDLYAADYKPKDAVFAARDRCGETVDMIRSVRTKRHKYIRNFFPDRPLLQPTNYKDTKDILICLRELHQAGTLNEVQERLLFAPKRSAEELYDIVADPHETINLAGDPKHAELLEAMRTRLGKWMKESSDPGPESPEVYAKEMAFQISKNRRDPQGFEKVKENVALMIRWQKERPYRPEMSGN